MKKRKRLTAEKKIEILAEHFRKSPVSATSAANDVHPNQINQWVKVVLEAGVEALNGKGRVNAKAESKRQEAWEDELAKKDAVIAQLASEVINLKKSDGATWLEPGSSRRKKRTS